jgi:predicted GNAT family N-acyltransferase
MEVRRIRDGAELKAALDLREAVYVVEQGVSVEGDRDGRDDEAIQLVAVADDGAVAGTCRILVEDGAARFGRLAVRRDARRGGLGAALLDAALREAQAAGARTMVLHAQTGALGLYERAGFTPFGERFMEEGIEHQGMERALA